jgi:hypothetical protein
VTLIDKEAMATGAVGWKMYKSYIRACGGFGAFTLAIACLWLSQGSQMASNFWLSIWSDR